MQDSYSRIVGLMNVFDEGDLLPATLTALVEYVDQIILVDGAYPDWPSTHNLSEDDTRGIARRIAGNKLLFLEPERRLTEGQKFDLALDLLEKEKDAETLWVFIFGADELLTANETALDKLRLSQPDECRLAQIELRYPKPHEARALMPRVFRLTGGAVRYGNQNILNYQLPRKILDSEWHPGMELKDCSLLHLRAGRNRNRELQRKMWYASQAPPAPVREAKTEQVIFQPETEASRRLSEEVYEIISDSAENYKRTSQFHPVPILVIMSVRRIPEVLAAFRKIDFIDKVYIRNFTAAEVSDITNIWLQDHGKDYTHIILTSDDVAPSQDNIHQLLADVSNYDLPVVGGFCNICLFDTRTERGGVCGACLKNQPHEKINVSFLPVFQRPITRSGYYFLSLEWAKQHQDIHRVWFQGNACGCISMETWRRIPFRSWNDGKGGLMQDLALAQDLADHGIPQFIDFRVNMKHYGTYHDRILVGKEEKRIDFETARNQ